MRTRLLAVFAPLLALCALAAPASAGVVFTGDFETGNLSQWQLGDSLADHQYCTADDALVYSAASQPTFPAPPQGTYAVRLKADNTDVSPCTPTANPRSQLGSLPIMLDGVKYSEFWRIYIPASFPDVPSAPTPTGNPFFVNQQDFAAPFSGSPPMGFGFHDTGSGDRLDLRLDDSVATVIWSTDLAPLKGRWVNLTVTKTVSTSNSTGFVRLILDSTPQSFNCTTGSVQCPVSDQEYHHYTLKPGSTERNRFYLANYRRKDQTLDPVVLYFDEARIATTLLEANPYYRSPPRG